jgi:uncharacterized protein with PIN domain
LLALDATATSNILQNLFRKKETLKVGYAFKSDVFALDNALKKSSGNGSPVALIENIIDISSLHRHLYQLRCPSVHSCGEGGGLGGLVNANLGLPLDKSQQCSAWGSRPLTLEQLKYAATDAACLIALYNYFLHCWEQRQQKSAEDNATEDINDENSSLPSNNVVLKFSQAQLRSSVERWAERWELTGSESKKIQKTGGLSQYDVEDESLSTAAKKKKNRSAAAMLDFLTFPLQIPWMDAKKESIVSSPLFIADVMLQGLARQLRLWGFDAESVAVVSKTERHVVHRQLVERAEVEGRVILTRDAIFMRRNLSDQAYFVRSENKKEQLQEVVDSFKLPLLQTLLLSRCAHCNSEFGETPVPASELSTEEFGIPPGVLERVNEFWVCSGCKKVYWQGSMYERAMERLGEALQSMTVGGGSRKDDGVVEQQAYST